MSKLRGRRVPVGTTPPDMEPGDYFVPEDPKLGKLWFRDPVGNIGSVQDHEVTENANGTITVNPSILDTGEGRFHGWLKNGVWSW